MASNAMDVDTSAASNAPPQPAALPYPVPTELPQTDHIILDVDGRKHRTRKSILSDCAYFANLLSGRWPVDMLPDGSLPIDADPETWPIIFTYIKRPTVFPLLWTREKGFDYVTYNKLMAEADFFGLDDLKDWIRQKKYMKAVKSGYKMEVHPGQLNPYSKIENNHTWLHTVPFPKKRDTNWGHEMDDWPRPPPSQDSTFPEDIELVASFEAKIPSQGDFKCPMGRPWHASPGDCFHDGCDIPHDEEFNKYCFEWDSNPSSIVTIIKYIDYRPERCTKDYFDSDRATTKS